MPVIPFILAAPFQDWRLAPLTSSAQAALGPPGVADQDGPGVIALVVIAGIVLLGFRGRREEAQW